MSLLAMAAVSRSIPAFPRSSAVSGRVVDELGAPIPSVQIRLEGPNPSDELRAMSDEGGRFGFVAVPAGVFVLRAEKPGYYAFVARSYSVGEAPHEIEITLNHRQEFEETVEVVYAKPDIDRQETSVESTLSAQEIVDLPYSSTHDFRRALPLLPGVIPDGAGRLHLGGGTETQTLFTLDGFDFSTPVAGTLENRISADSIRSVRVETSRMSAEFGRGSAGALSIETSRGDDRFRAWATNFLPSFEIYHGPLLSHWTPRATVSGPIVKGRAWFLNATDVQYNLNVIDSLPRDANRATDWQGNNLSTFQVNLGRSQILTSNLVFQRRSSDRFGLSALAPLETTRSRTEKYLFATVKDQVLVGGWIVEAGAGLSRLSEAESPRGSLPYQILPSGSAGNYFSSLDRLSKRLQLIASAWSPTWSWYGRHRLRIGVDLIHSDLRQETLRRPIEIFRQSGTASRYVTFSGSPDVGTDCRERAAFLQDRWSPSETLWVEAGIRADHDSVSGAVSWSPRFSASWNPRSLPGTKFSAGVGIYRDAPRLDLLVRALDQTRTDVFFAEDGQTVREGPVKTAFSLQRDALRVPASINWSVTWEQRLPGSLILAGNWIRKSARRGWSYELGALPSGGGDAHYQLDSVRRDSYSYLEWTLSRNFKQKYSWLASYVWSRNWSSAVIDFSLDDPVYGRQAEGPVDWDVPHRAISWGTLPLPHLNKYLLAYFVEWRSGFPWSAVDELQNLAGLPNSRRMPAYFNLNLHVERRFRLKGTEWALRAGFNNITGHRNPVEVVDNLDSPQFGEFSGSHGRAFTGRIRFLARH